MAVHRGTEQGAWGERGRWRGHGKSAQEPSTVLPELEVPSIRDCVILWVNLRSSCLPWVPFLLQFLQGQGRGVPSCPSASQASPHNQTQLRTACSVSTLLTFGPDNCGPVLGTSGGFSTLGWTRPLDARNKLLCPCGDSYKSLQTPSNVLGWG